MIDVIINSEGGLTVAHTLVALDGYNAVDIQTATGRATLSGPGGSYDLGTLQPSMMDILKPGMVGRSVRTSGWTIAKISPLEVRHH